jgi:hypothetical protein
MRKWVIALLFLLGCLCLVVYFRLGDNAPTEKKPSLMVSSRVSFCSEMRFLLSTIFELRSNAT